MMSKSDQAPVLIIGAGVAGLSLAAILQQNSIPYLVFESSPPTRMQRHGITLYPWAYLPLCQALGIKPERLRSAVATDSAIGGMGTVDLMMRDIHAGGSLQHKLETSIPEPHEVTESFRANKSAMREFFMERIDTTKLFWEWKLKSIGNDDGCIAAEFEGREATKGRLLVAADGLQSVGRHYLVPEIKPTITPLTIYNGRRVVTRAKFDATFSPHMRNNMVLSGYGDGFALEINVNSINNAEAVISWTYSRDGLSRVDASLQASQPHPEIASLIIKDLIQLRDLSAPFDALMQMKELEGDTLYNWVMRSIRIPLPSLLALANKKAVLIGDAAHAMPIYKGTGSNQALLDSVELGSLLCSGCRDNTKSIDTQLVSTFFENAFKRWQDGIAATESKLQKMH